MDCGGSLSLRGDSSHSPPLSTLRISQEVAKSKGQNIIPFLPSRVHQYSLHNPFILDALSSLIQMEVCFQFEYMELVICLLEQMLLYHDHHPHSSLPG